MPGPMMTCTRGSMGCLTAGSHRRVHSSRRASLQLSRARAATPSAAFSNQASSACPALRVPTCRWSRGMRCYCGRLRCTGPTRARCSPASGDSRSALRCCARVFYSASKTRIRPSETTRRRCASAGQDFSRTLQRERRSPSSTTRPGCAFSTRDCSAPLGSRGSSPTWGARWPGRFSSPSSPSVLLWAHRARGAQEGGGAAGARTSAWACRCPARAAAGEPMTEQHLRHPYREMGVKYY
mmetsp:Transcript_36699/g.91450  ORF Transcript_36699/g.91450 Transcript_36699/m.91450 type:complete len:239 (+) Transcript_36699:519-1235(+)